MLDIGRDQMLSQVVSIVFYIQNSFKSHRVRCSHCAMALDDSSLWLPMALLKAVAWSHHSVVTPPNIKLWALLTCCIDVDCFHFDSWYVGYKGIYREMYACKRMVLSEHMFECSFC